MRQEQDRKADTQGHWTEIATICGILGKRMVKEEKERDTTKGQRGNLGVVWLRAVKDPISMPACMHPYPAPVFSFLPSKFSSHLIHP